MTPKPCHYCNMLVSRDLQGSGVHATHPAVTEPWTCPASPTGRHRLLPSDDCTCGRHPHGFRLTHADSCALADQYRERPQYPETTDEEQPGTPLPAAGGAR